MLIQTGGSPSLACREFIHLLDQALPNINFTYFSDHDRQGGQMFTNIKYGSRSSSWATDIMTCPSLQWCGPTQVQLLEYLQSHHDGTEAEWATRKEALLKKMSVSKEDIPTTDGTLFKSMENLGLFNLEPTLMEEMRLVKEGQAVSNIQSFYSSI